MASRSAYDLIIMDLNFGPGCMKGSTAIEQLRAVEAASAWSQPPRAIIACSGNAATEGTNLIESGAEDVWSKPFPSFSDGSLQRRLAKLFAGRQAP